jgi:DNA-binding response OmpR family regulator
MSPEPPLLFIVDDDPELRRLVTHYLGRNGFEVIGLSTGDELLQRLPRLRPALAIVDVMMPGTDGIEVLRHLRAMDDNLPVIMLTAVCDEPERILGLDLGADDYLGKPFSVRELLSRIRAVLRRRGHQQMRAPEAGEPIPIGAFLLDPRTRSLTRGNEVLPLLASDFALLRVLASHPLKPLSRPRLLEMTGSRGPEKHERSIDAQMVSLRRLIEDNPSQPTILQTVRGIGYMFVPPQSTC